MPGEVAEAPPPPEPSKPTIPEQRASTHDSYGDVEVPTQRVPEKGENNPPDAEGGRARFMKQVHEELGKKNTQEDDGDVTPDVLEVEGVLGLDKPDTEPPASPDDPTQTP